MLQLLLLLQQEQQLLQQQPMLQPSFQPLKKENSLRFNRLRKFTSAAKKKQKIKRGYLLSRLS